MNPLHRRFLSIKDNYEEKHLNEILPSSLANKYRADEKQALANKEIIEFIQKVQKLNGKTGIYKVYKFPV